MIRRRRWLTILSTFLSVVASASIAGRELRPSTRQQSLFSRESQVWRAAIHDSEFASIQHVAAHPSCEATRAPEALATPDPLLIRPTSDMKVTVSFIIGTDGRIHSPLILESTGPSEDNSVLKTVRAWRYRPATCNGIPTEAEGKIEFSSR